MPLPIRRLKDPLPYAGIGTNAAALPHGVPRELRTQISLDDPNRFTTDAAWLQKERLKMYAPKFQDLAARGMPGIRTYSDFQKILPTLIPEEQARRDLSTWTENWFEENAKRVAPEAHADYLMQRDTRLKLAEGQLGIKNQDILDRQATEALKKRGLNFDVVGGNRIDPNETTLNGLKSRDAEMQSRYKIAYMNAAENVPTGIQTPQEWEQTAHKLAMAELQKKGYTHTGDVTAWAHAIALNIMPQSLVQKQLLEDAAALAKTEAMARVSGTAEATALQDAELTKRTGVPHLHGAPMSQRQLDILKGKSSGNTFLDENFAPEEWPKIRQLALDWYDPMKRIAADPALKAMGVTAMQILKKDKPTGTQPTPESTNPTNPPVPGMVFTATGEQVPVADHLQRLRAEAVALNSTDTVAVIDKKLKELEVVEGAEPQTQPATTRQRPVEKATLYDKAGNNVEVRKINGIFFVQNENGQWKQKEPGALRKLYNWEMGRLDQGGDFAKEFAIRAAAVTAPAMAGRFAGKHFDESLAQVEKLRRMFRGLTSE